MASRTESATFEHQSAANVAALTPELLIKSEGEAEALHLLLGVETDRHLLGSENEIMAVYSDMVATLQQQHAVDAGLGVSIDMAHQDGSVQQTAFHHGDRDLAQTSEMEVDASQAEFNGSAVDTAQAMRESGAATQATAAAAVAQAQAPQFAAEKQPRPYHEVKRRRRLTPEETRRLTTVFQTLTTKPDAALRQQLADELGMTARAVQVWFQNRRAKMKREKELIDKEQGRGGGAMANGGANGATASDMASMALMNIGMDFQQDGDLFYQSMITGQDPAMAYPHLLHHQQQYLMYQQQQQHSQSQPLTPMTPLDEMQLNAMMMLVENDSGSDAVEDKRWNTGEDEETVEVEEMDDEDLSRMIKYEEAEGSTPVSAPSALPDLQSPKPVDAAMADSFSGLYQMDGTGGVNSNPALFGLMGVVPSLNSPMISGMDASLCGNDTMLTLPPLASATFPGHMLQTSLSHGSSMDMLNSASLHFHPQATQLQATHISSSSLLSNSKPFHGHRAIRPRPIAPKLAANTSTNHNNAPVTAGTMTPPPTTSTSSSTSPPNTQSNASLRRASMGEYRQEMRKSRSVQNSPYFSRGSSPFHVTLLNSTQGSHPPTSPLSLSHPWTNAFDFPDTTTSTAMEDQILAPPKNDGVERVKRHLRRPSSWASGLCLYSSENDRSLANDWKKDD